MKRYINPLLAMLVCLAAIGCSADDSTQNPYKTNDKTPPGQITVTSVDQIAGGAIIRYNTPSDPDLMYVKALFQTSQGETREARASFYVDSIKIHGLGDTNERIVSLYAVDRNENVSAPVFETIIPGEPSVATIANSLTYIVDWGGFILNYVNADRDEVGIYVGFSNENQPEETLYDVFFTSRPEGTIAVRGLESLETSFYVVVKDRWDNTSDSLKFTITPWNESELDKKRFRYVPRVLDDVEWFHYAGAPENLYDNVFPQSWNFAHTAYPIAFPHAVTIDLGVIVKMSRFRLWQYLGELTDYYAHGAPRLFRVWGCPAEANPYEADSWILLMDEEMKKPSGGSFTSPNTLDDMEEANRGHEFVFDMDIPKIRYFRFQSLASWSGMECSRISEITIWGDIESEIDY